MKKPDKPTKDVPFRANERQTITTQELIKVVEAGFDTINIQDVTNHKFYTVTIKEISEEEYEKA